MHAAQCDACAPENRQKWDESLLRELRIDRVRFAEINLVATFVGSLFCIGIGRVVDRLGSRAVLRAVTVEGLAPIAWVLARSTPEECGLRIDGDGPAAATAVPTHGATLAAALRSPAFWVFALSSAVYGLVASGIALFNESILAERGFDATMYYRSLVFPREPIAPSDPFLAPGHVL